MKNNRIRYYAIVLIASLVSMVAATGFIYAFVRENLIDRSMRNTAVELRSVMKAHVSVFEQADAALSMISVNNDIVHFFDIVESGSYIKSYRTFIQLQAITLQYDFIDYASVYDLENQRVTATKWGLSEIQSYTKEQIPALQNIGSDRILHFDVLQEQIEGELQSPLRIGRYFPLGYLYQPKTYISLTLSNVYLKQLHERISPTQGDFLLTDALGNVIYSSGQPPAEFVESALHSDLSSDDMAIIEVNLLGKPHLFAHLRSPGYDLIYSYMIPMSAITADADFMIGFITVLIVGIILVLCVAGVLSVRRLSLPIDRIRDLVGQNAAKGYLLLPELVQEVKHVYDENQNMAEHIKLYKLTQRTKFLWRLLSGPAEDDREAALAHFDLPFRSDDAYCVVIFSADGAAGEAGSLRERNRDMLLFYILRSLQEELTEPFRIEAVDQDDLYLIFCGHPSWDSEEVMDSLFQTISSIHRRILSDINISITVGISDLLYGIRKLPDCRRHAESARDSRWMFGFNRVILYRQSTDMSHGNYPYDIEKRLLTAFKATHEADVFAALAEFHAYVIKSTDMSVEIGQHYFLQLLSSTYRTVYDWCGFCLEAIPAEQESYAAFLAEQTADKLYDRLRSLYQTLLAQLEKRRSERHQNLSHEIAAYIDKNFSEDISLDSIAEIFKISTSHLRRVFREETGWSIKGYINNTRIEKARELLTQTDQLVNDIALLAGYVSPQTFSRVFKKETGYTPSEYRRAGYREAAERKDERRPQTAGSLER